VSGIVQLGAVAGALLTLAGLAVLVGRVVRWMLRTLRKISDFLDDWRGEPPRPGYPGRPGVPERLARIEAQLWPNGGSSLHDKVNQIRRQVVDEPD
jgi:hypothetical protein